MLCGLCRNSRNSFLSVKATVFHFCFVSGEGQEKIERMSFAFFSLNVKSQKKLSKFDLGKVEAIMLKTNSVQYA